MAYSEIEQLSLDIDIFFHDNKKLIHLASGGGRLPKNLANTDSYNDVVREFLFNSSPEFEIDINPNLLQILNITEEGLDSYLSTFVEIAKRGFYSYDKSSLGNFQDMDFHLVAKPKSNMKSITLLEKFEINNFMITQSELPETFDRFNLNEFV